MASLTLANLETRVANALRLPTGNATEMAKVDALVNGVYREIYGIADWWWLTKRAVFNTTIEYTTGTVSLTNASTTVTLSTAPTGLGSFAGRVLIIPGNADAGAVYRISAHSADSTSVTLDAAYTGSTATAAGFYIYKDSYALATDVGKVLNVKRYGYTPPLEAISPEEMHTIKSVDVSSGKPDVWSVIDTSTTGDPTTARMLVVHPYPDTTLHRLEYHYKQALNTELATTDKPYLPDDYREILWYGALARGYVTIHKDVQSATYFQALYSGLLQRMVMSQHEHSDESPRMQPRDQYRTFYGRRRRINPATSNLGTFFDRWPINP